MYLAADWPLPVFVAGLIVWLIGIENFVLVPIARGLRRERNGPRPGQSAGKLGEDGQVSMKRCTQAPDVGRQDRVSRP